MLTGAIPASTTEELVELARQQHDDAIMQLIDRCASRIVAGVVIAGVRRYDPDFEDAQNIALFEIWRSFPKLKERTSVCYWMHGIARRVTASRVIDPAVRQRRRAERAETDRTGPDRIVKSPGDTIADRDLLGRVLADLSDEHREVLVIRFIEGFSEQETASLLDIPVKTVSSRTSRAKRAAMDIINELEGAS